MMGRDLDFDLHNAIQDLIAEGLLEENASAHSVARLVIHDGYDSLTPAQRVLYDAVVAPALAEIEGKKSLPPTPAGRNRWSPLQVPRLLAA